MKCDDVSKGGRNSVGGGLNPGPFRHRPTCAMAKARALPTVLPPRVRDTFLATSASLETHHTALEAYDADQQFDDVRDHVSPRS
jgi:hypothetical protein